MQENFREFLGRLRDANELIDIKQPVDIRHIATLVDQSDKALLFHNVIGYDMPVVSGIIRSRERAIMSMGCKNYGEIEEKLREGIDNPIAPRHRRERRATRRSRSQTGDEVDLFKLPIPMSSIYDGGPMITAGVVIAQDPELRPQLRHLPLHGEGEEPHRHRHRHAEQHAAVRAARVSRRGGRCPISISHRHASDRDHGAGYRAPIGVDEMAIAGGLRGAPVELAQCETIDLP